MIIKNSTDSSESEVGLLGNTQAQPYSNKDFLKLILIVLLLGICMAFLILGLMELMDLDTFILNNSLKGAENCTIDSTMTITSESDGCTGFAQILFINYTFQNEQLQSTIATKDTNAYANGSSILCSASSTDKYYVVLNSDIDNSYFIIMISLGCVGVFLTVIVLGFYYRAKMFGEIDASYTTSLLVMMGFMMITMICLAILITSLVFLGMIGNVWVTHEAGQCNVTSISYNVTSGNDSDGCYSLYTLKETVLILNTNVVGQLVSRSDHISSYLNDGRKVGGTYPCFYYQSDVVYSRGIYYGYIISGVIGLILTIWAFTQLTPTLRLWYKITLATARRQQ